MVWLSSREAPIHLLLVPLQVSTLAAAAFSPRRSTLAGHLGCGSARMRTQLFEALQGFVEVFHFEDLDRSRALVFDVAKGERILPTVTAVSADHNEITLRDAGAGYFSPPSSPRASASSSRAPRSVPPIE